MRRGPEATTAAPRRAPRSLLCVAWLAVAANLGGAAFGLASGEAAGPAPTGASVPASQPRGVSDILRGTAERSASRPASDAAVQALLDQRADAVLRRDRAAFLDTVDPYATDFGGRQRALFDNLAEVPLGSWSYTVDPRHETPLPPGLAPIYGDELYAPAITLRYALADFDPVPTSQQQRYLFVRHGARWYLTDDGTGMDSPLRDTTAADDPTAPDGSVHNLWDYGPVSALRTDRVLVLGHPGSVGRMRRIMWTVHAAIPRVTAVWGERWAQRVVVVVPGSADELSGLVEEPGDLGQIAAFASSDLSATGPPTGRRIVVSPDVFPRLSPLGGQVVLTHEITHLAARDVTSRATPYWLAEGFADYVAYRGTGVSTRSVARELADSVSHGRAPERLPMAADFGAGNTRLAEVYEQAWLACTLIVARAGEDALVRMYRQVSAAADPESGLARALRTELRLSTGQFTAAWRQYLREQLR